MQYTIKQAATQMNIKPHTLRYYESEGLIPGLVRDDHGNRLFTQNNLDWLGFVKCMRATGMPIKEMKHFVSLMLEGDETIPDRIDMLHHHKENIEENIKQMENYLENVKHKISYYENKKECDLC